MRVLMRALLVAILYLIAAQGSIYLHDFAGSVAIFWPAAGVAVAGLVVSPTRTWPAILGAIAAAEFTSNLIAGFSVVQSVWWTAANVIVALVAATLIRHWKVEDLGNVHSVARLVVAIAVASSAGAAVGAVGTVSGSDGIAYLPIVLQWAVGDGLGILTVLPIGLLVTRRIPVNGLSSPEGVASIATVVVASLLVFVVDETGRAYVGEYVVLIPMMWVAVRFKQAGTAIALFLVAHITTTLQALGMGSFLLEQPAQQLSGARSQMFIGAIGVSVLLLAGRTAESERYQCLATAREQLVASVSHELRTPLTAIVGFGHTLMREAQAGTTARRAAEAIVRNGEHLTSLVEDLLQVARTRHGTLPTQPTTVAVANFMAAVVEERTDNSDVHLSLEEDAIAWVDALHLRQIVTNLLDNAARYGRPPVHLDARVDGENVVVTITDDGDGVPDWFVPHLFDEFSQVDTSHRSSALGLGLGLPIARTLARANGGDLAYRSCSGAGAQFVVTLPLAQ